MLIQRKLVFPWNYQSTRTMLNPQGNLAIFGSRYFSISIALQFLNINFQQKNKILYASSSNFWRIALFFMPIRAKINALKKYKNHAISEICAKYLITEKILYGSVKDKLLGE